MRFLLALALAACTDFNPDAQTTTVLPEVDASIPDAAVVESDVEVEEDAAVEVDVQEPVQRILLRFASDDDDALEVVVGGLAALEITVQLVTTRGELVPVPDVRVDVRFDDGPSSCRPRPLPSRECTAYLLTPHLVTDEYGKAWAVVQGLAPIEPDGLGPRLVVEMDTFSDSRAFRVVDPDF